MSARRVSARRGDQSPFHAEACPRRARRAWLRPVSGSRAPMIRTAARVLVLTAGVLAAAWVGATRAEEGSAGPPIPEAVGFVNDHAGKLDEPTRAKLEAFLDQVKRKTGAEFAVLIMPSTAPVDPSEYKVSVFQRWGLGKKGEDNGLLMLVAIEERQVRFETGYGLEGTLPDGLESRIFRREMAPRFREGDYAGGITAGVLACAARIAAEKNVTLEWNGEELRYDGGRDKAALPIAVIALLFILFMVMIPAIAFSRRRWRGGWYIGPGGFGGGGFGGFGGGGGGGGGFGGGSFGGFGGGASGGGGGGGSW